MYILPEANELYNKILMIECFLHETCDVIASSDNKEKFQIIDKNGNIVDLVISDQFNINIINIDSDNYFYSWVDEMYFGRYMFSRFEDIEIWYRKFKIKQILK